MEKKITGKSFVKFFPTSKLEIEFHSHKKLLYQNSISPDIYLSWTLSVPSFRKIKETFLSGAREVAHNYHGFFFTRKLCVKLFLLNFKWEFLLNWSGTSNRKFYKRIPFNFDMGSFYKEFPCNFFLQGNPFTFFPNFEI